MRRRLAALGALTVVVLAGLVVHFALPDSAASDIAGDILYAAAVYFVVVVVAPRFSAVAVGAIAAGWGVAIELFQLTDVPARIAEVFPLVVLVLGTAFDPRDLVVATVVPTVIAAADVLLGSVRRRPAPRVDG